MTTALLIGALATIAGMAWIVFELPRALRGDTTHEGFGPIPFSENPLFHDMGDTDD